MTINERIETARRERRVLTRVSRAAWRLEQAERERTWALVPARAEGISIRALATAVGLSPSRVHRLVAGADLDALDAALGELRAAGWPAFEDPDSGEDTGLDGRDNIAERLSDEVSWLRQCAGWLAHLDADSCPPAVNLRPAADWLDRAIVAVVLARVAAVIDRIAADVDELARARRAQDMTTAAVLSDPRAERRRWLAEPDLEFRAFCTRRWLPASSTPQLERAWDAWQAQRYQRGEISQRPGYTARRRRSAVKARTQASSQIKAFLVDAGDELRARLRPLRKARFGRACAALEPDDGLRRALAVLGRRWLALDQEARELEAQITALVTAHAPQLLARHGVGPVTAARS